jgi:hypothetical protein
MKWIVFFSLFLTAMTAPASAQVVASDSSQVHVVRPGDTLWDLAGQYLRNPFLWPEIFSANRSSVVDPDLIFPQARLLIPFGVGRAGVPGADAARDFAATGAEGPAAPRDRTVFFPGEGQRIGARNTVRLTPRDEVPVVPAGRFFSAGFLTPERDLLAIGRIVEVVSPTVIERSAPPQIQPYDKVNLVVSGEGVSLGERVQFVRRSREVRPYGRLFVPTGSGEVLSVEAGVATVEVDRFYDRVEVGDIAVPTPGFDVPAGVAPIPATGLEGQLLAFQSLQPLVGAEDVAFVNLGAASGVVVGDEFEVFLPAEQEDWGRRPEVVVAKLQVIRVTELTSAVRVASMEHPALAEGLPVRLTARMP